MNRLILRAFVITVLAAGSSLLIALPSRAQVVVTPPPYENPNPTPGYGYNYPPPQTYSTQPGYGPGQGFPGQGFPGQGFPGQGFPGQGIQQPQGPGFGLGQGPQFGQQPGGPQALSLPDGVDQLYALQGPNALLMFGTEAGYATTREIVRDIEGDLDVVRVQVSLVRITRTALPGVTLTGKTLTSGDLQKLLDARRSGQLPASATVRVTTRENTAVDALLGKQSDLPLTLIPRVGTDGKVSVQFIQPLDTTVTVRPGETTALALAPPSDAADGDPFSVLFITPTILPGDQRR